MTKARTTKTLFFLNTESKKLYLQPWHSRSYRGLQVWFISRRPKDVRNSFFNEIDFEASKPRLPQGIIFPIFLYLHGVCRYSFYGKLNGPRACQRRTLFLSLWLCMSKVSGKQKKQKLAIKSRKILPFYLTPPSSFCHVHHPLSRKKKKKRKEKEKKRGMR